MGQHAKGPIVSSKPVIDDQILEECYLGDTELIAEIVQVFAQQKDTQVGAILTAVRQGDANAIGRAAHKLKGGLLTIGGSAAGDAALQLEKMGKSGSVAGAEAAAKRLVSEVDRLMAALRARSYL